MCSFSIFFMIIFFILLHYFIVCIICKWILHNLSFPQLRLILWTFLPSKHSSWWRHLEYVLKTSFVFVFRRRLHQDDYDRLSLTSSEDVFKTSWSRPIYSSWPYVFKTSSRRFEDVFQMAWRHLQDVLQRYLQHVFKAYHQVLLNTSLRSIQHVSLYRGICLGDTTSEKFMVSVQNLQEI